MKPHKSSFQVKIPFGKYKGASLGYILERDRGYLEWMTSKSAKSLPKNWRKAAKYTLEGKSLEKSPLYDPTLKTKRGPWKGTVRYINQNALSVTFPFNRELVELLKLRIDGRKWNKEKQYWTIPPEQILSLVELFGGTKNLDADDKTKEIYREELKRKKELNNIRVRDESDLEIDLKLEPYGYQKVAVEFVERAGGRALIADCMGVGKSLEAIAYAEYTGSKTLIVCPKSVVVNWRKEVEKFTNNCACIWTTKGKEGHGNCKYHIINYDIVERYIKDLNKAGFGLLVCDEATYLKNRRTKRAKSVLGYWKQRKKYPGIKTDDVIFLTGTPILNKPVEAYNLLSFLDKKRFNNFYQFVQRYGGAWNVDPQNLDELHERTKDLIIRRRKEDILSDLPKKQRNDLFIGLSKKDRKDYHKHLESLFKEWQSMGRPSAAQMPAIQNFLTDLKLDRTKEIIDELLEADRSILIFSVYINPLEKLKEEYGDDAAILHGGMNSDERQETIDKLTSGEAKVGLFSIGAGSMGIDGLQNKMDMCLFLNMWWTPAIHSQAEDRLVRIGQKNKVQIYYMICENTIDEYMKELLDEKLEMIEQIVEGDIITAGKAQKSFFRDFVGKLQSDYRNELENVDTDVFIDVEDDDLPD